MNRASSKGSWLDDLLTDLNPERGPHDRRWLNEISPEQRCWTPYNICHEIKQQQSRLATSLNRSPWARLRRSPHYPHQPPELSGPCPRLIVGDTKHKADLTISNMCELQKRLRPKTLDDLPMQHSRRDAWELLEKKRLEIHAAKETVRSDGGESRRVSDYSRRRFDSAVCISRGEGPAQPVTPDEEDLFYRAPQSAWSSTQKIRTGSIPSASRTGANVRPQSSMFASARPPVTNHKQRPDSEPPYTNGRLPDTSQANQSRFNHLRRHRYMYPEIDRLVKRYDNNLRVVCGQDHGKCSLSKSSRPDTDLSVASGFFLVSAKPEEVTEVEKEEDERGIEAAADIEDEEEEDEEIDEDDFMLDALQGDKSEDQLAIRMLLERRATKNDRPGKRERINSEDLTEQQLQWRRALELQKQNTRKQRDDDGRETNTGITLAAIVDQVLDKSKCWVDDATVSTVHSRAASPEQLENEHVQEEENRPSQQLQWPDVRDVTEQAGGKRFSRLVETLVKQSKQEDTAPDLNKKSKQEDTATDLNKKSKQRMSNSSPPIEKDKKDKKGKKKETAVELPPPSPIPVPVEELVEVEVAEDVTEPEPEPEPVPPTYICPSSESKSHKVEIRRWLDQSPFRAASRTMSLI